MKIKLQLIVHLRTVILRYTNEFIIITTQTTWCMYTYIVLVVLAVTIFIFLF